MADQFGLIKAAYLMESLGRVSDLTTPADAIRQRLVENGTLDHSYRIKLLGGQVARFEGVELVVEVEDVAEALGV